MGAPAAGTSGRVGWPFLIGAGRRRGYGVLVAPDVLVAAGEYGVLADVVAMVPEDGHARVVDTRVSGGRRLWVAYVARPVTAGDVRAGGEDDPRDEAGRRLHLLCGFVTASPGLAQPDPADLDMCYGAVLPAYRSFLDDEDRFSVVPSASFALRSAFAPAPPESGPRRAAQGREPAPGSSARTVRRSTVVGGAAVLGLVVAAAALTGLLRGAGDDDCPTPSASAASTTVSAEPEAGTAATEAAAAAAAAGSCP